MIRFSPTVTKTFPVFFAVGVFAGFSKVSSHQYSLTTLGMRSVVSYCPSMLIFPTNWTYTLILCVCTMFHKKGDTQAVTEIDHGFSHRVIIRLIITPWLQRFRIPFFASVVVGGFGPGTRRLTTSSMFTVYKNFHFASIEFASLWHIMRVFAISDCAWVQ